MLRSVELQHGKAEKRLEVAQNLYLEEVETGLRSAARGLSEAYASWRGMNE